MDAIDELNAINHRNQRLVTLDSEDRVSLERRMSHLERTLTAQDAVMRRNTEILDEIRRHLNKPTNWPEWISAIMGIGGTLGVILWAVFVQPVEIQVNAQAAKVSQIEQTLERNKELFQRVITGVNDHVLQHNNGRASE